MNTSTFTTTNSAWRKLSLLLASLIIGSTCLMLAACSDDEESNDRTPREEKTLPDDFPKEIPIYQPSEVSAVSGTGSFYVVGIQTNDSEEDVIQFYNDELTKNGWSIDGDPGTPYSADYDGDRSFSVTIRVTNIGFDTLVITITAPKDTAE